MGNSKGLHTQTCQRRFLIKIDVFPEYIELIVLVRDHGDSLLQAVNSSIVDLCRPYCAILTSEHRFVNAMNVSIRYKSLRISIVVHTKYSYVKCVNAFQM